MSSLPAAPAFYHVQPRASFFSRIMADRFNKVGNRCKTFIILFGVSVEVRRYFYTSPCKNYGTRIHSCCVVLRPLMALYYFVFQTPVLA